MAATMSPPDSPASPAAVRAAAARINSDVGFMLQSPTLYLTEVERASLVTAAAVAAEVQDGDRRA